jgi:hypothetical protein
MQHVGKNAALKGQFPASGPKARDCGPGAKTGNILLADPAETAGRALEYAAARPVHGRASLVRNQFAKQDYWETDCMVPKVD